MMCRSNALSAFVAHLEHPNNSPQPICHSLTRLLPSTVRYKSSLGWDSARLTMMCHPNASPAQGQSHIPQPKCRWTILSPHFADNCFLRRYLDLVLSTTLSHPSARSEFDPSRY